MMSRLFHFTIEYFILCMYFLSINYMLIHVLIQLCKKKKKRFKDLKTFLGELKIPKTYINIALALSAYSHRYIFIL